MPVFEPAPRIHNPDYDDPKEPYAFYGLASYYSQCFEQSLIMLIVALQSTNEDACLPKSFEEMFVELEKGTMGVLLKQVSKIAGFSLKNSKLFSDLLIKRNSLVHGFFYEHSLDWVHEDSRRAMLDELRDLAQAFQDGDEILKSYYEPLWDRLGLTDEIVLKEWEKLVEGGRV